MFRSQIRSGIALLVMVLFLCATSLVHAAENSYMARTEDVSAEEIIVDGLLLRPSGIVATVAGTVVFVVTLPFSIPTKSVDKAAQKLIVDPARYTFVRPLGLIESNKPVR
jgi:uncharacterized membrane protein